MYWVVAHFHEDPRAETILHQIHDIMWLHRDFYTDDGTYKEGVAVYSYMSLSSSIALYVHFHTSFGLGLDALDWARVGQLARYHLASSGPDCRKIDFGDSHMNRGWSAPHTLAAMAFVGDGDGFADGTRLPSDIDSDKIDSCQLLEYFRCSWYFTENPFRVLPFLTKVDWASVTEACDPASMAGVRAVVLPGGGYASFRSHHPNPNAQPRRHLADRYENYNFSMLAIQARPNAFAHAELDFGTVVWVAGGVRMLYDLSYGTVASFYAGRHRQLDNNPAGHNTLVVRNATSGIENTCQFDLAKGTMEHVTLPNGLVAVHVDGSSVYGRDRAQGRGWLDKMHRWAVPLANGHYVLVDSFAVSPQHQAQGLAVDNHFWTASHSGGVPSSCSFAIDHVEVDISDGAVKLTPSCSGLHRYNEAEITGWIHGASLQPGGFVDDGVILYDWQWSSQAESHRIRFQTHAPVQADARAFLLSSASRSDDPQQQPTMAPNASVTLAPSCNVYACFVITVDKSTYSVVLTTDSELGSVACVSGCEAAVPLEVVASDGTVASTWTPGSSQAADPPPSTSASSGGLGIGVIVGVAAGGMVLVAVVAVVVARRTAASPSCNASLQPEKSCSNGKIAFVENQFFDPNADIVDVDEDSLMPAGLAS
eukprot:m.228476 g.228476  ORF g.228476 m.228476 type:complete len:650 (+) comp18829_c0_seq4:2464-4413(+)